MNIYQNGDFSKNLHKLTKYQSLAATELNASKRALYSQKIQEYKNKMDMVKSIQTGGNNDAKKTDILSRIKTQFVPVQWQRSYQELIKVHTQLNADLTTLQSSLSTKINQLRIAKAKSEGKMAGFNLAKHVASVVQGSSSARPDDHKAAEDLATAAAAAVRAEAAAAAAAASLTTSQAEKAAAEAAAEAARRDLAARQAEFDRVTASNTALTGELAGAKAQLAAKDEEIARLKRELEDLKEELKKVPKDGLTSDACDAKIEQMLTEIEGALNSNIATPTEDIKGLSNPIQAALNALQNLATSSTDTAFGNISVSRSGYSEV